MSYNKANQFMGILRVRLAAIAAFATLTLLPAVHGADLVVLKSGAGISGVVESGGGDDIRVRTGDRVQVIPLEKVDSIQFGLPSASAASTSMTPAMTAPTAPAPRAVSLPAGTPLVVRVVDRIQPKDAGLLHQYEASLAEPLNVEGVTVAPANSTAMLQVNGVRTSKLRRRSEVTLQVVGLVVNGKKVSVSTENVSTPNFEPDSQLTFKLSREVDLQ